jgi:hypothetical protein
LQDSVNGPAVQLPFTISYDSLTIHQSGEHSKNQISVHQITPSMVARSAADSRV